MKIRAAAAALLLLVPPLLCSAQDYAREKRWADEITPAIVVGNSFGGSIAFRFAQDFPELTRKLILVNGVAMPALAKLPYDFQIKD